MPVMTLFDLPKSGNTKKKQAGSSNVHTMNDVWNQPENKQASSSSKRRKKISEDEQDYTITKEESAAQEAEDAALDAEASEEMENEEDISEEIQLGIPDFDSDAESILEGETEVELPDGTTVIVPGGPTEDEIVQNVRNDTRYRLLQLQQKARVAGTNERLLQNSVKYKDKEDFELSDIEDWDKDKNFRYSMVPDPEGDYIQEADGTFAKKGELWKRRQISAVHGDTKQKRLVGADSDGAMAVVRVKKNEKKRKAKDAGLEVEA